MEGDIDSVSEAGAVGDEGSGESSNDGGEGGGESSWYLDMG